jgi:hypothetical protein
MKTDSAKAAKLIKQELTKAFPSTKFSVTSDNYSMGCSVSINWTDGPTAEQVEAYSNKYQYGHFDGRVDLYEYSNSREDIPQAKYVQTSRDMSDETRDKIIADRNKRFCEAGQIKDYNAYNEDACDWNSTLVYRVFNKLEVKP